MRCLTISITIFLNLVVFGICSYMYLLWSQYWIYSGKQSESTTSTYDQQIYLYNRGYLPDDTKNKSNLVKTRSKHEIRENIVYINNSRPRFPSSGQKNIELDAKQFSCLKNDSRLECENKTRLIKEKILRELGNVFFEQSHVLKYGARNNTYNVHYVGPKENYRDKRPQQVLCELMNTKLETLKRGDIDSSETIKSSMPKRGFFENKYFNSCVVVASSGALEGSNLGTFIDSHDIVLRFNHAPIKGFEQDVGKKTSIRVLNSQVATKAQYNFLKSAIFKNVTIVIWDPANYSATLEEWMRHSEFNFFPNFIQYRKQEERPRIFMVNPLTIWDLWDFMQRNFPKRLRKNPPSSGFLGLRLLLPHCNFVDVVEYIPSARVTKRCHYYDPDNNPACTFGVWHPLAAEKLLTYHLNSASDFDVFQKGFARIKGFKHLKC
ncbi:beta-galactoside alpha-2,6-sialyltransferase 1 [Sitophilus oryzae]|uniref:Beta-galactoside alpha-2,6-sialyltransferase 1 n=1 Tax=Sitophilus oryzae TaxID=7048 RepID=A0A6J2YPT2_SITOR|nr:beta-galactoside alpha-2,6-sialyltransferase 1 [Sitophilus oryzae]